MESMDSMGSETKEFHQKAWGKFHGNLLEQNSMESMEYLPCFPMLAWGSDYVESMKKMCNASQNLLFRRQAVSGRCRCTIPVLSPFVKLNTLCIILFVS